MQLAFLLLVACGDRPDPVDSPGPLANRIAIPAGPFQMGCDAGTSGCGLDEQPRHPVFLSAFEISTTEISAGDWRACQAEGGCGPVAGLDDLDDSFPAVGLDRSHAATYCQWAGGRLPTEAEWERAARGLDQRTYPWGEEEPDCGRAWTRACGEALVAVDAPLEGVSPEGLVHMAGNAWEIVSDGYDSHYYESSPELDPQGPASTAVETARGISLWSNPRSMATWVRSPGVAGAGCPLCGARCAFDVEE